jgi:DNA-binding transcriptional ArsR family regulator
MEPDTTPDYDLVSTLAVDTATVHGALSDPRRRRILALLLERAATARQLAVALDRSPQATTHHLDVLRDAGLVRVVRTEQVRATTQRWWGRTARVFLFQGQGAQDEFGPGTAMLREALGEIAAADAVGASPAPASTIRYARVPRDRAQELFDRLAALVDEFVAQPRAGDVVHGVVVSVFPTAWPPLPGGTDAAGVRPDSTPGRPPESEDDR